MTNGIGTESQWYNVIGEDDKTNPLNKCAIFHIEKDDFRVNSLEIGYVQAGREFEQGVIWLRFIVRDLKNTGPSDSDVIITLGKEEPFMLKRTLKFTQADAFVGFHGKQSTGTKYPIS